MIPRFHSWAQSAAVLLAVGCASLGASGESIPEAKPRVVAARVRKAGLETSESRMANSLYALKCGKCHKFYDPAAYESAVWQDWMEKMSRKSKLGPREEKALSDYLESARK